MEDNCEEFEGSDCHTKTSYHSTSSDALGVHEGDDGDGTGMLMGASGGAPPPPAGGSSRGDRLGGDRLVHPLKGEFGPPPRTSGGYAKGTFSFVSAPVGSGGVVDSSTRQSGYSAGGSSGGATHRHRELAGTPSRDSSSGATPLGPYGAEGLMHGRTPEGRRTPRSPARDRGGAPRDGAEQHFRPTSPVFHGTGDWHGFEVQFTWLSEHYEWSAAQMARYLKLALRDDALRYAAGLPLAIQRDYDQLLDALRERFREVETGPSARRKLSLMERETGETVRQYAARVERLVGRAYPGVTDRITIEELAVESLIRGVRNAGHRREMQVSAPVRMRDAISLLELLETVDGTEARRPRAASAREVRFNHDVAQATLASLEDQLDDVETRAFPARRFVTEEQMTGAMKELKATLTELRAEVASLKERRPWVDRGRSPGRTPSGDRRPRPKEEVECYACHEKGHYSRECPKRLQLQELAAKVTRLAENLCVCEDQLNEDGTSQ